MEGGQTKPKRRVPGGPLQGLGLTLHLLDHGTQTALGAQDRVCLPTVKEYFNILEACAAALVHPG